MPSGMQSRQRSVAQESGESDAESNRQGAERTGFAHGRMRAAVELSALQHADSDLMKILVVEDSSSMRAYLTTVIESGDHPAELDIVEAASGFEALKMLPHHHFDAILTDINMPDINGLELVSFLKSHPVYKAIPIMVISTESSDEDRRRAAALGAEEYLVKPFQADDLLEKLQRLLKVA